MDSIVQYLIYSLKEEEIYKNNRIQHKESYILRLITLAYLTHKTMRVKDLLKNKDLGSGPTIQTYVTHLVLKQFVVRKVNDEDRRVKFLIPTVNAIDLFRELSKTLYDERVSKETL
jgi:DNA-binding MarR family transcriptional regulator